MYKYFVITCRQFVYHFIIPLEQLPKKSKRISELANCFFVAHIFKTCLSIFKGRFNSCLHRFISCCIKDSEDLTPCRKSHESSRKAINSGTIEHDSLSL